jgi:hypothetical protein
MDGGGFFFALPTSGMAAQFLSISFFLTRARNGILITLADSVHDPFTHPFFLTYCLAGEDW